MEIDYSAVIDKLRALRDTLAQMEHESCKSGHVSMVDTVAIVGTLSAIIEGTSPFDARACDQERRALLVKSGAPVDCAVFGLRWHPEEGR